MTKPLQEKTNVIVDYVRQKTEDTNDWVHIGSRDIPRIFGISQLYAARLLEAIKAHPNIVYQIDEKFPTRFKPYMFKWVENREEKINAGLSPAQFYWLTQEEVERLKNIDQENDYEATARVMRLCNTLVSEGAKEWWTAINIDTMSDLIVASQSQSRAVIAQLIKTHILVKAEKHSLYRLVLDPNEYAAIKEEANADEVRVKPKQERKKRKPDTDNVVPLASIRKIGPREHLSNNINESRTINDEKLNMLEKIQENTPDMGSNLSRMSKTSPQPTFELAVKNVKILEQVARDAAEKIQRHRIVLEQLSEREAAYERSYNAFIKLEEEYNSLTNELEKANEKSGHLEMRVRALESESKQLCEFNDRIMEYAQARMDVMLGQISSLIDEYVSRPRYDKKDEVVTARLKKNVFSSVLGTIDEIVDYRPESKAVPDLK